VPSHAAVNETVSLVKSRMGTGPGGLANAVLRAASALVRRKGAPRPEGAESRMAVASTDGRFTVLAKDVVPGIDEDPPGWLAGAYGYPRWLVERWVARFGRDGAEAVLGWGNAPPPLCVRLNPLRTGTWPLDAAEAARVFEGCDSFAPADCPGTYRMSAGAPPGELPGFRAGLFTVQDETQVRPARVLAPARGARVLDLCAGLGGKTTQLAEVVGPEGHVVALESDVAKIELARAAAARPGLANVEMVEGTVASPPGPAGGRFPFVLLDAPCSNLGALARRPEVRHRASPDAIRRLASAEVDLLRAALERVEGGGAIVYSVCSLEDEETSLAVRAALEGRPEFRLEAECHVVPLAGARDGGYCARITRGGAAP